jgi:hypothetical protein
MSLDDFRRTPADDKLDRDYERGTGERIRHNFQGSIFYPKDASGRIKSAIMVFPCYFISESGARQGLWLCVHNCKLYLLSRQLRPHAILLHLQKAGAGGRQLRAVVPPDIREEFEVDGNDVFTATRIKDGVFIVKFSKRSARVKPEFEFPPELQSPVDDEEFATIF